jgi:hypothetical protein
MSDKNRWTATEWKAVVDRWRMSGLNARLWCRQNRIIYTTFLGWRNRLQKNDHPQESQTLPRSSFIEISETAPDSSGVIMEFQGIQIHLSRGFDSSVLQSCLKTLKEGICYR